MTGSAPAQLRPLRPTDVPAVLAAFHAGTVGMADPAEVTDEASARAYVDGLVQAEGTDAELAEGGLERIELAHRADSPTAGAVARAAGLRHEGTQRGRLRTGGRRLDVHLYGRLAADPLPEERVRPLPWASDARPWADR